MIFQNWRYLHWRKELNYWKLIETILRVSWSTRVESGRNLRGCELKYFFFSKFKDEEMRRSVVDTWASRRLNKCQLLVSHHVTSDRGNWKYFSFRKYFSVSFQVLLQPGLQMIEREYFSSLLLFRIIDVSSFFMLQLPEACFIVRRQNISNECKNIFVGNNHL